jgi:hypothetical protein
MSRDVAKGSLVEMWQERAKRFRRGGGAQGIEVDCINNLEHDG